MREGGDQMPSSATAALIHRRVARLQALVRGQQSRKRVVESMRLEYDTLRRRVNREAFGGQDEAPYEDLVDLGFFESADEWKGATRRLPQLLPISPPRPRAPSEALPCAASSTEPTMTEAAAGAETGVASVSRARDYGAGGACAARRSKEDVLAELARVRRAIQERIEALRVQQQQQPGQQQQEEEARVGSEGPPL